MSREYEKPKGLPHGEIEWKAVKVAMGGCFVVTTCVAGAVGYGIYKLGQDSNRGFVIEVQATDTPRSPILYPSITPNPTEVPTSIPTLEPSFTPDPYRDIDSGNKARAEAQLQGEEMKFNQPLVRRVFKYKVLPLPGIPSSIFAVLSSSDGKSYALLENANCLFDYLRSTNQLGEKSKSSESWSPSIRIDEINTDVYLEKDFFPWAIFTVKGVSNKGNNLACPKDSQLAKLKLDPKELAKRFGKGLKDIVEGFEEGIK